MASLRPQSLQDLGRIKQPSRIDIRFRLPEGLMQGRTVVIVEPVARIERQKLHFRAFRQACLWPNPLSDAPHEREP